MSEDTTQVRRFWARVDRGDQDECWPWIGGTSNGYGRVWFNSRQQAAHRIAYELMVGPIPEGMQLDHLCRNHGCCNPRHLEPVTHAVNIQRMIPHRRRRLVCPKGHDLMVTGYWTEKNGKRHCLACQQERIAREEAAWKEKMRQRFSA